MEFGGEYHGIQFKVSKVHNPKHGVYFDVSLFIGGMPKAHDRVSTLIEAINKLVELIRSWDLEDKDILMTEKQAEARISAWKAALTLIKSLSDDQRDNEELLQAINTIFHASIDLSAAGYRTTKNETDWYLPGEAN